MRSYGTLHPTQDAALPPDSANTLLIAGSSGQAMDWPSGSSVGGIVRFSGVSTAGALLNFMVNLMSTKAAAPSSGASTEGTTGYGMHVQGTRLFQIPGDSTGFSVAALSSGYVTAEVWKKGG